MHFVCVFASISPWVRHSWEDVWGEELYVTCSMFICLVPMNHVYRYKHQYIYIYIHMYLHVLLSKYKHKHRTWFAMWMDAVLWNERVVRRRVSIFVRDWSMPQPQVRFWLLIIHQLRMVCFSWLTPDAWFSCDHKDPSRKLGCQPFLRWDSESTTKEYQETMVIQHSITVRLNLHSLLQIGNGSINQNMCCFNFPSFKLFTFRTVTFH